MNTQHFHVTLNYEGPDPESFDAEGLADTLFHDYQDSDNIDRMECVQAIEEPQARPSYEQIENLLSELRPTIAQTDRLSGPDLSLVSVLIESIAFVLGDTNRDEYTAAIERAKYIATPLEERLAQRATSD